MNLNRLLLVATVVPSLFVVAVVLVSFFPHQWEALTHGQEHLALAAVMVAGIVPFGFFMLRIFRRVEAHILLQNDALSRRTTEMEALLKVGRAAEESLELDRVLPAVGEAVLEATSAEAVEVWLLDQRSSEVVLRHHHGAARDAFLEITRFPLGEGYPGIAVETGQPILAHNLPEDGRFLRQKVKDAGFQTFHALPLRRTGGTIGVLTVAARDAGALVNPDELRLLDLMADHIATAVENAQLHEEVQTLAVLTERERLAREMHDGMGQVLGYVSTKAQAVKELLKGGKVDPAIRHMEQLESAAQETYDDIRQAILALGTEGGKRPLLESLDEYVNRFAALSDLPATLAVEGPEGQFNPRTEVQLLRIVQEALANTRKHARASRVEVRFSFNGAGCRITVEDDGRGFEPERVSRGPWPHLGLQSMRERAASIGAGFAIDAAPGRGARVVVDLPDLPDVAE